MTKICLQLHIQQIDDAIKLSETLAGWRLYVTNAPITQLTASATAALTPI